MIDETLIFNNSYLLKSNSEVIHYVLMNICKKTNNWRYIDKIRTRYKEAKFTDLKWIIDHANFFSNTSCNMFVVSPLFLQLNNDSKLVPEYFRSSKNHLTGCYLSLSDIKYLNKAILKWKIYGRYCVWFKSFKSKKEQKCLKSKLKDTLSGQI